MYSYIHRYPGGRKIIYRRFVSVKDHGHDIEERFHVIAEVAAARIEIPQRGRGDLTLFDRTDIFLRSSLHRCRPGLHFYKMHAVSCQGDNVYLKMPATPVAFEYPVSDRLKIRACAVFTRPACLLSVEHLFHGFYYLNLTTVIPEPPNRMSSSETDSTPRTVFM